MDLFQKYKTINLLRKSKPHKKNVCQACKGRGYIIEGRQGYLATICVVCGGEGYVH